MSLTSKSEIILPMLESYQRAVSFSLWMKVGGLSFTLRIFIVMGRMLEVGVF